MVDVVCAGCSEPFEAKTRRAKWCSDACKMRAARSKDVDPVAIDTPQPLDEGLVAAVRSELEETGRLETVAGQLALQLARKLVAVDASGVSGLSKELRAVRAEALDGVVLKQPESADEPRPAEVDDEVTRARRQREEARQAAGLA
jgi:hypothetical protein